MRLAWHTAARILVSFCRAAGAPGSAAHAAAATNGSGGRAPALPLPSVWRTPAARRPAKQPARTPFGAAALASRPRAAALPQARGKQGVPGAALRCSAAPARPAELAARPSGVRVLRIADPAAASGAARLRISGRMVDVCAELDRMAANDAQALPRLCA